VRGGAALLNVACNHRERARPRVGRPVRAPAGARPVGPGPLRCSPPEGGSGPRPRMAGTLLTQRAYARSSTSSPSRRPVAARCPSEGCAARRRPCAHWPAHPQPCEHHRGVPAELLGAAGKAVGGCAVARLMRRRGGEQGHKRSGGSLVPCERPGRTARCGLQGQDSWPRAQRATCPDSSRLFEHSERSERREFRDGPRVRCSAPRTQNSPCGLFCAWRTPLRLQAQRPQGSRRAASTAASRATPHTQLRLCALSRSQTSKRVAA